MPAEGSNIDNLAPARLAALAGTLRVPRPGLGLSAKLLLLTLGFVMLSEILIFVPSVANFRVNWLMERLQS